MSGVRCLLRALGRLLGASWVALGGSWEGLGSLWEASKRHLGPKTVRARISGRFLKKIGNFGGPSWRRFNIKNRIFQGSKRAPKIKLILKAFWHRFWDDFRGSGNVKNEVFVWKGRIFFEISGIVRRGAVLDAFWEGLG